MNIGQVTIRQTVCEIDVNSKTGYFTITAPDGGRLGFAVTLENAIAQASAGLGKQKIKVAVPFVDAQSGQRGVATGIHAGHNNIMARMEDGSSVVLSGYRAEQPLSGDIPEEELKRMLELKEQAKRDGAQAEVIRDAHTIDLRALVEAAIAEAREADHARR